MAGRIFGRESTADEVLAGIDCAGRVVLITGASGRLGAEAARALAQKGARVTITARDLAQGRQVRSPGGQGFHWKSVPAGAATAPELENRGALYLEDCGIAAPKTSRDQLTGYGPYALDPVAAARLWTVFGQMIGETFAS